MKQRIHEPFSRFLAKPLDPLRLSLGDWWKEEDLPVDWDALLPGGPLVAEVGFGGGEFLLSLAQRSPQMRFVGIERFGEGHRRLQKSLLSSGLHNVLSMVGDAYVILGVAFANAALRAVHINYSDPWPKARHADRRLLSFEFLSLAARKLEPGGRLYAATDDVPYAHQAAEALARVPLLASLHPGEPWVERSPHGITTRYERKWRAEGRALHYFAYERRSEPCPT
jgi:tRNA (guanine-N7-)-methyltransferase